MKKKNIILFLLTICLIITGCGKDKPLLEAGNTLSDISVISDGRFDISPVIDISLEEGYFCTDALFSSDRFLYLVKNNTNSDIRFISFGSDGNDPKMLSLSLPFTISSQKLDSGSYKDLFDDKDIDNLSLFYFDPKFTENDYIEGYFSISGIRHNESSLTDYISRDFKVTWDFNGSIREVEPVELEDSFREDLFYDHYRAIDEAGNNLTVTDTGIVRSSNGKYVDTYFDFVNSSFSGNIEKIVYGNEDLFSAIICDSENKRSFSILKRVNTPITGITPVSLYCSSADKELCDHIIDYNLASNEYRIGIRNYVDIVRDYDDDNQDDFILYSSALAELKSSVFSGDIPDLIYEGKGFDRLFIDRLSSDGLIIDLSDTLKKDKSLKDNKYLDNIYDLSGDDGIYGIIPSFTFDTYIAAASNDNISVNWTLDDYSRILEENGSKLIMTDTYYSDDFILKALGFNGYSWIDTSEKQVSLGGDFVKYLELAKELPSNEEEFIDYSFSGGSVNIQAFYASLGNLSRDYFMLWYKIYEDPVNVGFPTDTGSDMMIRPTGVFMICSDRAANSGCWDFVRSFLSADYQDSLFYGIPVVESSFEKWKSRTVYEHITESDMYLFNNGPMNVPVISDENAELFSQSVLSCNKYYFTNPEIEEIVLKNAHEYFDGKVSVDEAKENIEKEIRAYLNS